MADLRTLPVPERDGSNYAQQQKATFRKVITEGGRAGLAARDRPFPPGPRVKGRDRPPAC